MKAGDYRLRAFSTTLWRRLVTPRLDSCGGRPADCALLMPNRMHVSTSASVTTVGVSARVLGIELILILPL